MRARNCVFGVEHAGFDEYNCSFKANDTFEIGHRVGPSNCRGVFTHSIYNGNDYMQTPLKKMQVL